MAETLVENNICEACGADVRPGSQFCYNCGGAVTEELPKTAKKNKKNKVSDSWRQESMVENNDLKTTRLDDKAVEDVAVKPIEKPIEKTYDSRLETKFADKPPEKLGISEEAKLRSAANMRRKSKTFQKKTVEIVWEEPESAPNKWFPIVAFILILLVVGIFYLAIYLK
jgi:hypothetical protein